MILTFCGLYLVVSVYYCVCLLMIALVRRNVLDLPVNSSLNFYWCSGFALSAFVIIQVITGVLLSFLYSADVNLSFASVVSITNDEGLSHWLFRYLHVWGVTLIFLLLMVHIGRGLYYSSYSKKVSVWNVGFILYLLMMVESFFGYILPWHQMSYWAATILSSIIQSIPFIGNSAFVYVVGGFSISNATLVRVFSIHVCLAFVILGLIGLHLFYLHMVGSNTMLHGSLGYKDVVWFNSFFVAKDALMIVFCLFIAFLGIFAVPDFFLDIESNVEANMLVTPISIKPEWYFLGYYAMLRSVESKLGGMFLVILFLFVLWLPLHNTNSIFNLSRQLLFWFIVSGWIVLTYFGWCHAEYPFVIASTCISFLMIILLFLFKFLNWH